MEAGRLVSRAKLNLLSEEEAQDTPSRREGVSAELETSFRIFGCEMIQEMSILLKL